MNKPDDASLMRQLAALMGWEVYTEEAGQYDRWQRVLVNSGGANSCFIDLDGKAWIYDNPAPYLNANERLWLPLQSMSDAWMIVERISSFPMDTNEDYQRAAPFLFALGELYLWHKTRPEAARAICTALLSVHARAAGGDSQK